jgi:methionyl-tRNA formyltransferase
VASEVESAEVGCVVPLGGGAGIATGRGILKLVTVQLEGKRPVTVEEFVRGQSDFINSSLIL